MSEHTTVCDCGMPLAVHAQWVGRHIRCPHCDRDYVLQRNLTVLPPEELAAAFPISSAPPRPRAIPIEALEDLGDLDITLSAPTPRAPAGEASEEPPLELAPAPQAAYEQGRLFEMPPGTPREQLPPIVFQIEPNRWMPIAVLIVGLLSLPAVFLWGIGSLICGATALVLGTEAMRIPCRSPWMRTVGLLAGAVGVAMSVVYWLVAWKLAQG
jgi:hypothetical protein